MSRSIASLLLDLILLRQGLRSESFRTANEVLVHRSLLGKAGVRRGCFCRLARRLLLLGIKPSEGRVPEARPGVERAPEVRVVLVDQRRELPAPVVDFFACHPIELHCDFHERLLNGPRPHLTDLAMRDRIPDGPRGLLPGLLGVRLSARLIEVLLASEDGLHRHFHRRGGFLLLGGFVAARRGQEQ